MRYIDCHGKIDRTKIKVRERVSSTVCSNACFWLADVGVQIGFGASFGMLIAEIDAKVKSDANVGTILSVLDAAFIGAVFGLVSGLLGRVALICLPEAEEGTVRKVFFRAGNTLFTFSCACFGPTVIAASYRLGNEQSIHA